ncbi:Nn.00g029220.m01.CDS01 [Neocucurbitaria sp. VM-36]
MQQNYETYNTHFAVESTVQTRSERGDSTIEASFDPLTFDSFISGAHDEHNVEPANSVQTTYTIYMGPPAKRRKRKAPTLRANDWEPYKDRVLELHVTEGLPLPEVKKRLEEESGFTAELRQYRLRVSQWGKDKNVKPPEMSAIVRKRQRRKLVEVSKAELAFEVRGVPVEPQKIDRWMKRHEVPESLLYAPIPAASTPSAVGCRTISECGSPIPTFGFSPASSITSPGPVHVTGQSPQMSSTALSISSIVRSQGSNSAGQSPAPTYRSLPIHYENTHSTENSFQGIVNTTPDPSQYRYMQEDEERLQ